MSSGSIKKKYRNLEENGSKIENSQVLSNNEIQKKNFTHITKLVSDLFKHKDSQYFGEISDAMVSFLSLSKKEYSEEVISERKNIPFDDLDSEFKNILKQEFEDSIL